MYVTSLCAFDLNFCRVHQFAHWRFERAISLQHGAGRLAQRLEVPAKRV